MERHPATKLGIDELAKRAISIKLDPNKVVCYIPEIKTEYDKLHHQILYYLYMKYRHHSPEQLQEAILSLNVTILDDIINCNN